MRRTAQRALARAANLLARPRWMAVRATQLHARILRLSRGHIRRSLLLAGGQPVLVLTTVGRRTGHRHSVPVAYLRDGNALVITPGNAGLDRSPAWWLNLQADPRAEIELGGRRVAVRARIAEGAEAERLRAGLVRQFAGFEVLRRMTDRGIPILVLEPQGRD